MTSVYIFNVADQWVLVSDVCERLFIISTSSRLIDVIDVAYLLNVHISNADELPLKQYLVG